MWRRIVLFQALVEAVGPAWVTVLTVVTMIQSLRGGRAPGSRPEPHLPVTGVHSALTHRAARSAPKGRTAALVRDPSAHRGARPAAWHCPARLLDQAPCLCEPPGSWFRPPPLK